MNIFAALKSYAGKWRVKLNVVDEKGNPVPNPRKFNDEELAVIASAVVIPSEYGNSAEFTMTTGDKKYIPLDPNCTVTVGQSINMMAATIVVLEKTGEKDIIRLRI